MTVLSNSYTPQAHATCLTRCMFHFLFRASTATLERTRFLAEPIWRAMAKDRHGSGEVHKPKRPNYHAFGRYDGQRNICIHIRYGQLMPDKKGQEGTVFTHGLSHFEHQKNFQETVKNTLACLKHITRSQYIQYAGDGELPDHVNWVFFTDSLAISEWFTDERLLEMNDMGPNGEKGDRGIVHGISVINANARATVAHASGLKGDDKKEERKVDTAAHDVWAHLHAMTAGCDIFAGYRSGFNMLALALGDFSPQHTWAMESCSQFSWREANPGSIKSFDSWIFQNPFVNRPTVAKR